MQFLDILNIQDTLASLLEVQSILNDDAKADKARALKLGTLLPFPYTLAHVNSAIEKLENILGRYTTEGGIVNLK